MELVTGAMGTLLPKLGELLLAECHLKKSVKQGIEDLRYELLSMQATLMKLSDVPRDKLDPLVKIWADDIRELSYAIEDSLDSYIVSVAGDDAADRTPTFMGFIRKTRDKVSKLKIRHRLADEINDINIRVRKVKERHDRYKVHDIVADRTTTMVDPRLSAMYSKVTDLVGIDGAIAELTMRLSEGDGAAAKKLKAVSVVGFGGLGKTTLAKAVYDKLYKKFGCAGFVPVGQNPDGKKVLRDILYELDKKKHENITGLKMDERQLIDKVREYLADKRYLIVIDDIWDIPTWNMIKCALVDNSHGSRIMTTTRICEVAKSVGSVYNMNPLSNASSKELFWMRICGGEGISLDRLQLPEVSDKILRKCGGVPLSIITIASLLAGKQREDWCKVYDSIGFGQEENEAVQNTRKILAFSYYDLPSALKTCLLYLSLFPEDWDIEKDSLIWMWIAEGIILDKPEGTGLFRLGESYLNDLINRSMIQLIEPSRFFTSKFTCRVHDMVLDLIRNLSSELNFVTIHDKNQDHNKCLPSYTQSTRVARRLAHHKTSVVEHSSLSMKNEHMRSFIAMMSHSSRIPQILSFRVLRVLVLEQCSGFSARGYRLQHLGKLVQLRYLGLAGTPIVELPGGVGYDLKFLQTLDVQHTGIQELPQSIGEMGKLMCLRASGDTRMMGGVGNLTSLEHLELGSVDKSPNFASELGKLTEMRVLRISFDKMDESVKKSLLESMCNLRRIKELNIMQANEEVVLQGWEDWAPPSELQGFVLIGIHLPRQPSWIDFSCTPCLSSLCLIVAVLEARCVQALGKLPSLRFLYLYTEVNKNRISYTIGSDEFQKLVYLGTNMEITCAEGALPFLKELNCHMSVGGKDFGLVRSMPLLQKVDLYVDCKGCQVRSKAVRTVVASLEHAAENHPNHPTMEKYILNYTSTKELELEEDQDENNKNKDKDNENKDDDENEDEKKDEEQKNEEEEKEVPAVSKP